MNVGQARVSYIHCLQKYFYDKMDLRFCYFCVSILRGVQAGEHLHWSGCLCNFCCTNLQSESILLKIKFKWREYGHSNKEHDPEIDMHWNILLVQGIQVEKLYKNVLYASVNISFFFSVTISFLIISWHQLKVYKQDCVSWSWHKQESVPSGELQDFAAFELQIFSPFQFVSTHH